MKVLKKIILILILFVLLLWLFRAIGFAMLSYFNIDTSTEFGANIEAAIEIFSFIFAFFLSVKSF
jgi:hypothetical protein